MNHSESLTFNQLTQDYINKLKDAFQMLDEDEDGIINRKDLSKMYATLGKTLTDQEWSKMVPDNDTTTAEIGKEGVSFPIFLSIMGKNLSQFPEREELERSLKSIGSKDDLNVPLDVVIESLKEAGFENPEEEFAKLFKMFTTNQQTTDEKTFRGKLFLDSITD
ncbi:mlc2p [Saccharomyces arboricola H-6]|uniref:Mlc2p n=1 Tax=Saccharomyces arboricola (strain H-6 / AS 2.3317 / CBS 10644) TaxID=1160507 RepID=J8PGK9_SACAR|nr:mlc2p [Saccharomyces arboricola H-6]